MRTTLSDRLSRLSDAVPDLGAGLLFLVLTLVVTHPLVLNISSRVAACCDVWYFYWHAWFTGEALLGLRADQFFTDLVFYPAGTGLTFESMSNSILSLLLSPVFGGVAAFNLLYLLSYVLGAYGAYLLVVRQTGDRRAGTVAGVVFAFSTVRAQDLHLTSMAAVQWLPLLALSLLRLVESPATGRAVAAALLFALTVLSSGYYGVSAAVLVLLILGWNAGRVVAMAFIRPFAVFVVTSTILVLPLVLPVLLESLDSDSGLRNSHLAGRFSADLVSFILPSRHNPLYDGFVAGAYERLATHFTEAESYLGVVAVALAALGVYGLGLRRAGLWLAVLAGFSVLALGPYLQVLGREFQGVPMPFHLLQDLPVLDSVRSPKRFLEVAMLGLAVLSGYGAHRLFSINVSAWRMRPHLLLAILIVLVLADYWGWPRTFVTADATVPRFFHELAEQDADVAVLHIPLPGVANPKPLYYQTVHGKRLIGGYAQRPSPQALRLVTENAFLAGATLPDVERRSSLTVQEVRDAGTLLISLPQVEYVVLSKTHFLYPAPSGFDIYDRWLREEFGAPVYEDPLIAAWRVGG